MVAGVAPASDHGDARLLVAFRGMTFDGSV